MFSPDAWLEAGAVLAVALIGSLIAYIQSTARNDAKLDAIEITTEERKRQLDKELLEIKAQMERNATEFKTLIQEFRTSLAIVYNEKSEIRVDMAQNYLSKTDFYASLERISLQINAYQVNIEARFARLEERVK